MQILADKTQLGSCLERLGGLGPVASKRHGHVGGGGELIASGISSLTPIALAFLGLRLLIQVFALDFRQGENQGRSNLTDLQSAPIPQTPNAAVFGFRTEVTWLWVHHTPQAWQLDSSRTLMTYVRTRQ